MAYTQEIRLIAIDTPLGMDVLLLAGFKGIEDISGLFSFELKLLSENHNIKFEDIIGKNVSVSIILADGNKRFFNGIISSFSQGRGGGKAGGDPYFSHYASTMVPWFWLLTRTADSRIFQKLSVPDIVEKIFTEKGFLDYKLLLSDSYDKRDYCVQYRETDFNFISRLLEEEGICYFFEHEEKKHTLILADASDKFKPCPKQESARYQISAGGWLEEDVITSLEKMQEIRPAKYTINDFNFEIPNTAIKVDVSTKQMLGPGEREIYDYPGLYTKKARGERLTTIRMEEEETKITTITGSSDCRAFTSGYRFNLSDYYREDMDNKDYVLTHIEHEVREVSDYSGASIKSIESASPYINRFKCIPFDVPYRPSRDSVKPVVRGTQTAIVVGSAGEEIYTDEHGRVKVQFHWDREGKKDENSSCWIRVSQVSAGAGWGAIDVPRIGHEVIVDFLEGDPDRPIITGRVYHGANRPPFALPAGGMVSGSKSNSTPGGGGYNEMSMNDTKGEEKMTIHAQYDMDTTVEHDQTITVKSGNRKLNVDTGTNTETIKGTSGLTVQAGSRTVSVTGGDYSATSTDAAIVLYGKGKGVEITGDAEGVGITGNSKGVTITGNGEGVGITGNSKGVTITGNAQGVTITGKGKGVTLNGDPTFHGEGKSKATIKSPTVNIGDGEINITGKKIVLSVGGIALFI